MRLDTGDSMGAAPEKLPLSLRVLRALVFVLMVVMILGVITVVWLLVTRLPGGAPDNLPPVLPETLTLPEGAQALAVTFGPGWIAVVTDQNHILIFDKDGALRQDVPILPAP